MAIERVNERGTDTRPSNIAAGIMAVYFSLCLGAHAQARYTVVGSVCVCVCVCVCSACISQAAEN